MKHSTGASTEACTEACTEDPPTSWLSPLVSCYTPLIPCLQARKDRPAIDDGMPSHHAVVHEQPSHQPVLSAVRESRVESHEPGRKSRNVKAYPKRGRKCFSARIWLSSDAASRRPLISAPSNFRHLQSGSLDWSLGSQSLPSVGEQDSLPPFRPLELSKCMTDGRTSPILPHFDLSETTTAPPPTCFSCRKDEADQRLLRESHEPSLFFHIPRRQVVGVAPADAAQDGPPPRIPPKAQDRIRVSTAPEVAAIKLRVAGAMIEVERLQRQIDDVVERQSLYANSRPPTSHSTGMILPALQPMPSVPALPPAAPSFAERLNSDMERSLANVHKPPADASAASPTRPPLCQDGKLLGPPAPPAPRHPLRKKKSFTHVSDWLFPGARPARGHHSGTDDGAGIGVPEPVNRSIGCPRYDAGAVGQQSQASLGSASTWDTEEWGRTAATTWSAGSDSGARQELASPVDRGARFCKNDGGRRVGAAT